MAAPADMTWRRTRLVAVFPLAFFIVLSSICFSVYSLSSQRLPTAALYPAGLSKPLTRAAMSSQKITAGKVIAAHTRPGSTKLAIGPITKARRQRLVAAAAAVGVVAFLVAVSLATYYVVTLLRQQPNMSQTLPPIDSERQTHDDSEEKLAITVVSVVVSAIVVIAGIFGAIKAHRYYQQKQVVVPPQPTVLSPEEINTLLNDWLNEHRAAFGPLASNEAGKAPQNGHPPFIRDDPWNRYEKIRVLGKGSYGKVRLSRRLNPNPHDQHHLVAIKEYRPPTDEDIKGYKGNVDALLESRKTKQSFEIGLALSLDHPNIVHGVEALDHNNSYYLVLEYVEGVTLKQWLADNRPNEEKASNILFQMLKGLEYLHSKGLMHRDIKPANTMMADDGTVVIIDLGLVSRIGNTSYAGSKDYAAPELYTDVEKKHQDKRRRKFEVTDIYSLGIIARVMFPEDTERPPLIAHFITIATDPLPENRPGAAVLLQHPLIKTYNQGAPAGPLLVPVGS